MGKSTLGLILLLTLVRCAVDRGQVYTKDGQQYGVISSRIWRHRWWNYYERGVSYAEGGFWHEAIADFQAAVAQRYPDQRRARTYGLHFINYFPHRELGIVYYRLARYPEAIRELETSLAAVDNAKAKFYLNEARRERLKQSGQDTAAPRIVLDSPRHGLLTNRFAVTVAGQAEDDTYVAALRLNGKARFIELAEPRIAFAQQMALRDGANTLDIVAVDLVGRQRRKRVVVRLDRQGPVVSLDRIETIGAAPQRRVRLQGWLADRHRIVRFRLAGRRVPLQPDTAWEFRQDVPIPAGTTSLPFVVEDAAGNVTRGAIALGPAAGGPVREGKLVRPERPRWAALAPGTVLADLPLAYTPPMRTAQHRDRHAPVITLRELTERQTVYGDAVYLEGRVTDASTITAFTINGESLWHRPATQLFFSQKFPLQAGDNTFTLEAADEAGHVGRRTMVIRRELQPVERVGSRLRVTLLPFVRRGSASAMATTVYDQFFHVLVNQRRFDLVERQQLEPLLQELRLSQTDLVDPATAARTGRIMAAEGILSGSVTETSQALEVFVRFVDVETAVVLAALDVYGEDVTLSGLRTLMKGLAWKLRQHFPLVEGVVIDRNGETLLTDLSARQGVKQYMKLVVFRAGEDLEHPGSGRQLKKPHTILGEARITAVTAELSQATLLASHQPGRVQALDRVMTK